jgi:hypothetical protein
MEFDNIMLPVRVGVVHMVCVVDWGPADDTCYNESLLFD